jgi:hypothetical protein
MPRGVDVPTVETSPPSEARLTHRFSAPSKIDSALIPKEGEVYESGPEGALRIYGGWLYLAGELVHSGERMTEPSYLST